MAKMAYNSAVESFRDIEYPMLKGKAYLDHAGTTVYSRSTVEDFSEKLVSNLYGNPHSTSDPAELSGHAVDSIREQALRFFCADPEHFDLVFTANATAAIKLVGESFRDLAASSSTSGTFWYGYHKDAHTSLVGVRELAQGTHHCFNNDQEVEEWLRGKLPLPGSPSADEIPGLFAYPGQSNMTGRRLPLSWTRRLRQSSAMAHQSTYSLLDAAALATTTQLDFSDPDCAPDFTALSFYKIFGFPDLGALIVRRKSGHILSWRKYFGGGTINNLTVIHESTFQRKDETIHDGLEDGTLPFHSIVALGCAIDSHKKLYGSMKVISKHTLFLSNRLYTGISSLRYSNGRPLCVIYNDTSDTHPYTDSATQGATIAFNVLDINSHHIACSEVEKKANERAIYVRAGGLCNPGGIASHLKIQPWQFKRAQSAGYRCGDSGSLEIINGKPIGVVRASLGAMSTVDEVDALMTFLAEAFGDGTEVELGSSKLARHLDSPVRTEDSSTLAAQINSPMDDALTPQDSRASTASVNDRLEREVLSLVKSLRLLTRSRAKTAKVQRKAPAAYVDGDITSQGDSRRHSDTEISELVNGFSRRRGTLRSPFKFWKGEGVRRG